MLGAGPEWVHATNHGVTTKSVAGEVVIDFMFWPSGKRRFGWYAEPGYDYSFGRGHEQFDLRMVRCPFHEEPINLHDWKTYVDFSDPVWHSDGLILALLFPSLTTWRTIASRPCGQAERGDRDRVGRDFSL